MGSVSESLTSSGTIASHSLYDAYGNKLNSGSQSPFGFGGQSGYQTDTETDLLLLTHRYYDPAEGRFLNRDPIGYSGGLNLYAYCGNNPVERLDPSGLYWNSDDWGNFRDSMHWVKPVCVDGADALLQGNAEFWSGMGDHISLGATKYVRAQFGRDDYASSKSGLHKAGLYTGYAWDAAAFIATVPGTIIAAKQAITARSIILGRWKDGLEEAAKIMDASYLNIQPGFLYTWFANKVFLNIAYWRNIPIYFSSDTLSVYPKYSGFYKELQWLSKKGFPWVNNFRR